MAAVLEQHHMSLQTWHSEPSLDMQQLNSQRFGGLDSRRTGAQHEETGGGDATGNALSLALALAQGSRQQHTSRPAVAVRSVQGRRPYQEDSFAVVTDLLGGGSCQGLPSRGAHAPECSGDATSYSVPPLLHYAAVFDGHGGSAVSQHCAQHMAPILRKRLLRTLHLPSCPLQSDSSTDSLTDEHIFGDPAEEELQHPSQPQNAPGALPDEDATQALIRSFADCDASIPESAAAEGGSTAVCALLGPDCIWVANCGDSRAVVARRGALTLALTDDHKPERPDEAARIKAAGGHVFWNGGHRVMGVLSMSRAMGDQYLKQYGVIPTPEVTCVERTPEDEFLLLASDGLWMSLSNAEAVGVAAACVERAQARGADRQAALRVAAQVLVKAALQQGSSDNITVVLMDLQGPTTTLPVVASTAGLPVEAPEQAAALPELVSPMLVGQQQQQCGMEAGAGTAPASDLLASFPGEQQEEEEGAGCHAQALKRAMTPLYTQQLTSDLTECPTGADDVAPSSPDATTPTYAHGPTTATDSTDSTDSHVDPADLGSSCPAASPSVAPPTIFTHPQPPSPTVTNLPTVSSAPVSGTSILAHHSAVTSSQPLPSPINLELFELLQLSNMRRCCLPPLLPAKSPATKRSCSPDGDVGDADGEAVTPSKRSRLTPSPPPPQRWPSPRLDAVTERLLVAVPSPSASPARH